MGTAALVTRATLLMVKRSLGSFRRAIFLLAAAAVVVVVAAAAAVAAEEVMATIQGIAKATAAAGAQA